MCPEVWRCWCTQWSSCSTPGTRTHTQHTHHGGVHRKRGRPDSPTLTVPSDEALMMWWPSGVKVASFTKDEWPRNSFRVLPDFKPWILPQKREENVSKSITFSWHCRVFWVKHHYTHTEKAYLVYSRSPDGLVKGGAEELTAVFTETDACDSFTVCTFKPPQTLTALDLPHLNTQSSILRYCLNAVWSNDWNYMPFPTEE